MAMAVDSRQQGHQLAGWSNEHLRYSAQPQFTNPWVSAPSPAASMYHTSMPASSSVDNPAQAHAVRPIGMSIPPYSAGLAPTTAAPLGAGITLPAGLYDSQNLLDVSQGSYGNAYPSGTSPPTNAYAPTSAPQYHMDFSRNQYAGYQSDASRRSSHPLVSSAPLVDPVLDAIRQRQNSLVDFDRLSTSTTSQRSSFSDAIDAGRGMVALSHDLTTPRNIYGSGSRSSTDSYGFPSTHSAHSSISSASTYPSYYNGSIADSATDYSSASESVSDMNSRTLPRPSALVGTSMPPAPQSMMGQFSSKVSSSSQKKHKCKICDKRFTRPSSLQTHMYSHTGEKPFACEVEGCGRHFSVVSNLRRHRKVHKGERDPPSPDDA